VWSSVRAEGGGHGRTESFSASGWLVTSWKRIGDRRNYLRFDVLGTLSASLFATETLRVMNLGISGALVEATRPLQADADYPMRFVIDSHVSDVTVRIRRVTEVSRDTATAMYLIGLEFLSLSDEAKESIGRLVATSRES
jgi:hypothetical protein